MNWYKRYIYAGLPVYNIRKVIKKLKNLGAQYARPGKGSHEIWIGPSGRSVAVPLGNNRSDVDSRTIRQVVLDLGLNWNQFMVA